MSWKWTLLRAGAFKLDAGAMFGIIPKPVWSRVIEADDRNRITLQTNCLLLERGGQRVLVETGIGDKMSDKLRGLYDAQERSVLDALREAGCAPEAISTVIVTHLHFDHAGGLTRLPREGEGDAAVPAFPGAEVVTQRQEWEDALANRSTMHSTYLRDHLDPVADRVRLVEGEAEVMDAIRVRPVPGHTFGQQAVIFTDDRGRTVAFPGDLCPTLQHASSTWGMAYDVMSYETMLQKARFLSDACKGGWIVVLDHEPGRCVVRVERREGREGEFRFVPADS